MVGKGLKIAYLTPHIRCDSHLTQFQRPKYLSLKNTLFIFAGKEIVMPKEIERRLRMRARAFFTGAMKRYGFLDDEGRIGVKGLEGIRGDWCKLAKNVQMDIIRTVLKTKNILATIKYINTVIKRIQNYNVDLNEIVIWKHITKPIVMYKTRIPHVEVAKRFGYSAGERVPYVICKADSIDKHVIQADQAKHPVEMESIEDMDVNYYVHNQIIPVATRILDLFGVTKDELMRGGKTPSISELM